MTDGMLLREFLSEPDLASYRSAMDSSLPDSSIHGILQAFKYEAAAFSAYAFVLNFYCALKLCEIRNTAAIPEAGQVVFGGWGW